MQEECTKQTRELQGKMFGKRFEGASIGKISLPEGYSEVEIFAWVKAPKNFLVLSGDAGCGKTYFCSAIVPMLIKKIPYIRAYSERELFRKIRNHIGGSSQGDYLHYLHTLIDDELIVLDDLGSSGHTEWREEVLTEAIDYRYQKRLPTIITSNLYVCDFNEIYGQRITSRLFAKENTIVNFKGLPDLRQLGK